jgi:hypothetical protein
VGSKLCIYLPILCKFLTHMIRCVHLGPNHQTNGVITRCMKVVNVIVRTGGEHTLGLFEVERTDTKGARRKREGHKRIPSAKMSREQLEMRNTHDAVLGCAVDILKKSINVESTWVRFVEGRCAETLCRILLEFSLHFLSQIKHKARSKQTSRCGDRMLSLASLVDTACTHVRWR